MNANEVVLQLLLQQEMLSEKDAERFGSRSRKGPRKPTGAKRRDQDKDDFDETFGSLCNSSI